MADTYYPLVMINAFCEMQKQPLTVFYKKSCSKTFRNINRKAPVSDSLFNKAAGLHAFNFIKKRLQHRCFPVKIANV